MGTNGILNNKHRTNTSKIGACCHTTIITPYTKIATKAPATAMNANEMKSKPNNFRIVRFFNCIQHRNYGRVIFLANSKTSSLVNFVLPFASISSGICKS